MKNIVVRGGKSIFSKEEAFSPNVASLRIFPSRCAEKVTRCTEQNYKANERHIYKRDTTSKVQCSVEETIGRRRIWNGLPWHG